MVFKSMLQNFSFVKRFGFILLIPGIFALSAFGAGTLDTTFGTGGKVSFGFGAGSTDFAISAALQPDGKIVLAGVAGLALQSDGSKNFAVARLNHDGSLDNTFGNGGLVLTDFNNEEDAAFAIVIQPDGKIIVGGYRRTLESNSFAFALARYNPDGSLDTNFSGGKVATDFPESVREEIHHLFLQPDGKILAIGSYFGNGGSPPKQIAMVRYNVDGTLDASFGTGGKFTILLPRFTELGGAALQPDGKILISGYNVFQIPGCIPTKTTFCDTRQSFMMRYTPQLSLDKKFGRKFGRELSKLGFDTAYYISSLQPDGNFLVITGDGLKKYSSNGRVDTAFEPATVSSENFNVVRTAQRPDGETVGCGSLGGDIAVALYENDGSFIGSDRRDFFGGGEMCSKILVQPDGKIIVVGSAQTPPQSNSHYDFAVMRYTDITP